MIFTLVCGAHYYSCRRQCIEGSFHKMGKSSFSFNDVRDFCGIQLCIVLLCYAKWATGIPVIYHKKQKVSDSLANYEPGGREFESLRARHPIKQKVSKGFQSLFYLLIYPFFFQFSRKQRVTRDLEYLVKNQLVGFVKPRTIVRINHFYCAVYRYTI